MSNCMNLRRFGGPTKDPKKLEKKKRLIEKILKQVAAGLQAGLTYEQASKAASMNWRTFETWKEYAKNGKQPFAELWPIIENAIEEGMALCASRIMTAGKHDWKAAAWLLERRHPDQFGRYDRQQIHMQGQMNQTISIKNLSTEERMKRIEELEAKMRSLNESREESEQADE